MAKKQKAKVVAEEPVRSRSALPGSQDRLVVGSRRNRVKRRRGRTGLSRGGRPECLCSLSAGGSRRHITAGLDDDSLDLAEQPVCRRASRSGIRHRSRCGNGRPLDPGCRTGRNGRGKGQARTDGRIHLPRKRVARPPLSTAL